MGSGGLGLKAGVEGGGSMELNCDVGEGEAAEVTEGVARWVRRINVACGGHAGDDETMARCVGLARRHGLRLGAHPGVPGAFGRATVHPTAEEMLGWVAPQVERLRRHADAAGHGMGHVKLHGGLYHAVERDAALARVLARWASDQPFAWEWVGLPNGCLRPAALEHGLAFVAEGFLDRAYQPDGTLVPRGVPGAVRCGAGAAVERLERWRATGCVEAIDGTWVPLDAATWCVHGDSPGCIEVVEAVARRFGPGRGEN